MMTELELAEEYRRGGITHVVFSPTKRELSPVYVVTIEVAVGAARHFMEESGSVSVEPIEKWILKLQKEKFREGKLIDANEKSPSKSHKG